MTEEEDIKRAAGLRTTPGPTQVEGLQDEIQQIAAVLAVAIGPQGVAEFLTKTAKEFAELASFKPGLRSQ